MQQNHILPNEYIPASQLDHRANVFPLTSFHIILEYDYALSLRAKQ